MQRIRLVFAVLAVALLVPLVLLVQRALESVSVEREARHRTVAERVFDEVERELGRTARSEEERSPEEYHFYVGSSERGGARTVSPLSEPPDRSFVLGFFELDADGSFHSPRIPRVPLERRRAEARGEFLPSPALDEEVARLEAIVRRGLGEPAKARRDLSQAPGTTRKKQIDVTEGLAVALADEAKKEEESVDAYAALRSLNRAADARKSAKVLKSAPAEQYAASSAGARPRAPGRTESSTAIAMDAAVPESAPLYERFRESDDAESDALFEAAPELRSSLAVPVPPSPLAGRVADPQHLLLYRSVLLPAGAVTQGLVLSVPDLATELRQAVLGGSGLSTTAALSFSTAAEEPGAAGRERFAYVHRFAEPFDDLTGELVLPPLPDVAGATYLYAMALLLLLAGSVGLFALYRMVAVRVRFAERRSNFVAAVTHELKTPLTAVRMYGEMLRDGMVDSEEKRQEYAATITAESERLTRLINNVLEFSRLEQGTREMSLVAGPIAPVVEEAARILAPHARDVGFEIRVAVERDLPPVRFDRDAVLQVVFNLVDNALKYARDAGDRVIELRCAREGEAVVVAVRDRGPGVASRHLARIFEPFYRGEDELTRRAKGTGIGLSLVKGLTERMGAAVTPRSPAEGGFEVAISFRPATAS